MSERIFSPPHLTVTPALPTFAQNENVARIHGFIVSMLQCLTNEATLLCPP
jgi:hypothetical protein